MARHLRVRLPRRPLQPHRGHPLWLARPPHLFPLSRRRRQRRRRAARRRAISPWLEAWRRFRRHRLAVASAIILLILMSPRSCSGRCIWPVAINDIDFAAKLEGPSLAHPLGTDDLGQDLLARMLYGGRISLAVGLRRHAGGDRRSARIIGAIAGMSRGWVDAALMWLTDLFLSLPTLPLLLLVIYLFRDALKAVFGAGGRRLRPDRGGHRRPALDAGGAAGARAVPVAAREGIRRGGARARRLQGAPGGAAHPAQRARAGDRRRHDRRRGRHHRRIDAVVPRARLPVRHPDLGPHPVRRQGLSRHRRRTGRCSRAPRSSSPCWRSTSSATGCATRSIRAA